MARVVIDELKHYGIIRRSGRYPWGSGKDPYQRSKGFMGYVDDLKSQGMSDKEIATGLGLTLKQFRARRSIEKERERIGNITLAQRLSEKGMSNVAIGERMGYGEGTIRSWLKVSKEDLASVTQATANALQKAVDERTYIDIGLGTEQHLGISKVKLDTAAYLLESEHGYKIYPIDVRQQFGEGNTTIQVLCPPGTEFKDLVANKHNIRLVNAYTEDGGRTFRNIIPPTQVDSDRVYVRYAEDGGSSKDGVIELRRGIDDISMGENSYSQVRVAVDGTHYMKGMAIYGDIPEGYDFVYNTTKSKGTPVKSSDPNASQVFKPNDPDPDNPFGSTIRQKHYIDANGNKQLSALNMVGGKEGAGEEGSWETWSRNLSSQVLSKQTPALAKEQLAIAIKMKRDEYDEIMSLTNPTIRRKLLEDFANQADADAMHLKAAALPRQNTQVLLPVVSMKDNEVFAPNYRDGERVVLIRHPHGGTFEIPELVVNNKNPEAIRNIRKTAKDAVGINPAVAQRLSGADFDGDTVIVIPNTSGKIRSSSPLKGLESFDPISSYPKVEGMKVMTKPIKAMEMGNVSNLITDMTIKGASHDEIARAVRHSMVVIDAEKHKLNYKQSFTDNGIADLKKKYQDGGGASTLISKSSSEIRIDERKEGEFRVDPKTGKRKRVYIDPKTGKKLYEETGRMYEQYKKIKDADGNVIGYEPTGKMVRAKTKTKRMYTVDDAYELSSGTVIESLYASHANTLKTMANRARLSQLRVRDIPYSPSARKTFKTEVESLKLKLQDAFRNKPLERQAQLLTDKVVAAKKKENPGMDAAEIKKIRAQALEASRARVGASKNKVVITDREWMAIQAGAISPSRLKDILNNTDTGKLKERAMPRTSIAMTPAKMVRARTMLATGRTRSEIADALGVSVSTLANALEQ